MSSLMALAPRPAIVNVHATGGQEMTKAARDASAGRAKLIAVTILTSLSDDDIWEVGFETAKDTQAHARSLAALAKEPLVSTALSAVPTTLPEPLHDLGHCLFDRRARHSPRRRRNPGPEARGHP